MFSNYRDDNIIQVTSFLEELDEVDESICRGHVTRTTIPGGSRNQVLTNTTSMYKWNLTFDDNTSKIYLSVFLHRVERLKNTRNCNDEELF